MLSLGQGCFSHRHNSTDTRVQAPFGAMLIKRHGNTVSLQLAVPFLTLALAALRLVVDMVSCLVSMVLQSTTGLAQL